MQFHALVCDRCGRAFEVPESWDSFCANRRCNGLMTTRLLSLHDAAARGLHRAMALLDTAAAKKDETAHRKRAPKGVWS